MEKHGGEAESLEQCVSSCGTTVRNVWDRFAGTPSIEAAAVTGVQGSV